MVDRGKKVLTIRCKDVISKATIQLAAVPVTGLSVDT